VPVRVSPAVPNEVVGSVTGTAPSYGITYNCAGPDAALPRLLRITPTGARAIPVPHQFDDLLVEGGRVWAARWPREPGSRGALVPVGGGAPVRLPAVFIPFGVSGELLAGNLAVTSFDTAQPLVVVDARTGDVRANLGAGALLAIDDRILVWTAGCEIDAVHPCQAHLRWLASGRAETYALPRPPSFGPTAVSADHQLVAFMLERAAPDPRFENTHPFPPSDIAVLDLATGAVHILPGVELAAKTAPALAFTADNRLVVALNAGTRVRVLVWRVGDRRVQEASAIPGPAGSPPALLVLPATARITARGRNR
jgi:hypothetical protein